MLTDNLSLNNLSGDCNEMRSDENQTLERYRESGCEGIQSSPYSTRKLSLQPLAPQRDVPRAAAADSSLKRERKDVFCAQQKMNELPRK